MVGTAQARLCPPYELRCEERADKAATVVLRRGATRVLLGESCQDRSRRIRRLQRRQSDVRFDARIPLWAMQGVFHHTRKAFGDQLRFAQLGLGENDEQGSVV